MDWSSRSISTKQVNINQLQWPFRAQNCPDLQGKPKIFFIQQGQPPPTQKIKSENEDMTVDETISAESRPEHPSSQQKIQLAEKSIYLMLVLIALYFNIFICFNLSVVGPENEGMTMETISVKPRFSDVFLLLGNSYVYDNGTKFVQHLCHHLRFVNGVKATGRRDLHEAIHEMMQEISKEILYGHCNANESPIYQSTAAGKKFGFQVVTPEVHYCTQIHYYANGCKDADYLEEFINEKMKNLMKPKFEFHPKDKKYFTYLTIYGQN